MVIEKIWDIYDVDKSGELDRDEVYNFLKEALETLKPGSGKMS